MARENEKVSYEPKVIKDLGYKIGRICASVLIVCAVACLGACAIALTVKFITWLFALV